MAEDAGGRSPLCSEQFGSGTARGCRAAADGSLQWEPGGWRWRGFSRVFQAKSEGGDGGPGDGPGSASQPLWGLQAVFLPQGFPDSVSPDYLPYQLWDSVQVSPVVWGMGRRMAAGEGGRNAGRTARCARTSPDFFSSLGFCFQPLRLPGHPGSLAGSRGGKCKSHGVSRHGHLARER